MTTETDTSEIIYLRPTFDDALLGTCRDYDFQVIWRGLSVARITRANGLPVDSKQWRWRCSLPGRPLIGGDYGTGDSLDECEAAFRIAWQRIRAGLTDTAIAMALGHSR